VPAAVITFAVDVADDAAGTIVLCRRIAVRNHGPRHHAKARHAPSRQPLADQDAVHEISLHREMSNQRLR